MAAREEFGLTNATLQHFGGSALKEAEALFKESGKAFQAFLRAQYNLTQEYFAKNGITSLTGYRGMKFGFGDVPKGFTWDQVTIKAGKMQLQSLSSFSSDLDTAQSFVTGQCKMVLQSNVPVNRILSTCQTGYGCKAEAEFVILGGMDDFKIITYSIRTERPELLKLFADFKVAPEIALPVWKPVMTQAEADAWAKGSTYADDVFYHGTTPQNAVAIKENGFNLDIAIKNTSNGQMYGAGHYLGPENVATQYAYGSKELLVKAKINATKIADMKTVEIAGQKAHDFAEMLYTYKEKSYDWLVEHVPYMYEDSIKSITAKQWDDIVALTSKYYAHKRPLITNYLLKYDGYQAIESSSMGGAKIINGVVVPQKQISMLVVLDDKYITVIK